MVVQQHWQLPDLVYYRQIHELKSLRKMEFNEYKQKCWSRQPREWRNCHPKSVIRARTSVILVWGCQSNSQDLGWIQYHTYHLTSLPLGYTLVRIQWLQLHTNHHRSTIQYCFIKYPPTIQRRKSSDVHRLFSMVSRHHIIVQMLQILKINRIRAW